MTDPFPKPRRLPPDWDDFRPFLAVARGGSLSAAARMLRTTPSRIARRVQALEAALERPLFLRGPDGYFLTDDGKALVPAAEEVESSVGRLVALAGGSDLARGHVRIATSDMLARHVLAPRLGSFRVNAPEVTMEILAGARFVDLLRFEVDLALRMGRPDAGPFKVRRLARMDCALYVATDAPPDVAGVGIGWSDAFADLPAARAMADLGLPVVVRANGLAIQIEAVRAGAGAAVLPCFLGDADPGVKRASDELPLASQEVWLVLNADLAGSRRVRAVSDWVEDAVASVVGSARSDVN